MKRCFRIGMFLLAACVLLACGKDEDVQAAYRLDLAEAVTDEAGKISRLLLDDGKALPVLNAAGGFPADTVVRVQALYTESEDGATLNKVVGVLSPLPAVFRESSVRQHPVGVVALWRGGRYVNLLLALKTGGHGHHFAFIDGGIRREADGSRKARVELYHDQGQDPLYYTREVYLSCPLWGYAGQLEAGRDSVEFAVRTFEGTYVRTFPY